MATAEPQDPFKHRRQFFSRPAPRNYAEEWAEILRQPLEKRRERAAAMLVFSIAGLRLAVQAHLVKTVTPQLTVCALPHRHNTALLGLVSVLGEIMPCCSLARMLGLADQTGGKEVRTLVLEEHPGEWWALPVDSVQGVSTGTLHDYATAGATRELEPAWSDFLFRGEHEQAIEALRPETLFERMRRAIA